MIALLCIVIVVLSVVCFGMYLAIQDYKADLEESKREYMSARSDVGKIMAISRRRGQLLNDISNALPNDLRNVKTQELYYHLWLIIQEEIQKELKFIRPPFKY